MAPSLAPPQHKPQSSASALSDGPLYFPPAALFLGISGHPILGFEQASLHAIVAECFSFVRSCNIYQGLSHHGSCFWRKETRYVSFDPVNDNSVAREGLTEVWIAGTLHHIEAFGDMVLSRGLAASCIHRVRRAFILTFAVLARDINNYLPRHGRVSGSRLSRLSIVHFSHGALELCPAALWLGHDIAN